MTLTDEEILTLAINAPLAANGRATLLALGRAIEAAVVGKTATPEVKGSSAPSAEPAELTDEQIEQEANAAGVIYPGRVSRSQAINFARAILAAATQGAPTPAPCPKCKGSGIEEKSGRYPDFLNCEECRGKGEVTPEPWPATWDGRDKAAFQRAVHPWACDPAGPCARPFSCQGRDKCERAAGIQPTPVQGLGLFVTKEQLGRWHDYMSELMQRAGVHRSEVIGELYLAYRATPASMDGGKGAEGADGVASRMIPQRVTAEEMEAAGRKVAPVRVDADGTVIPVGVAEALSKRPEFADCLPSAGVGILPGAQR